jgi:hypothetical protein
MSTKCRAKNPTTCPYHGSPFFRPAYLADREMRENQMLVDKWIGIEDAILLAAYNVDVTAVERARYNIPAFQARADAEPEAFKELVQEVNKSRSHLDSLVNSTKALSVTGASKGRHSDIALTSGNPERVRAVEEANKKYTELVKRKSVAKVYNELKSQVEKDISAFKNEQSASIPEGIKNRGLLKIINAHHWQCYADITSYSNKEAELRVLEQETPDNLEMREKYLEHITANKALVIDLNQIQDTVSANTLIPTRALKSFFSK